MEIVLDCGDNTSNNCLFGDTVDEETIKEKKKELLKLLITARNLAEKGDEKEVKALLNSKKFNSLYNEIFLSNRTNKYDLLRNAINSMCYVIEGSENIRKQIIALIESGKKDSLRLIAEIEEELND